MNLASLVHNRWMMATRGVLAIAFGVSITVWPRVTLSIVVLLFGVYAIVLFANATLRVPDRP